MILNFIKLLFFIFVFVPGVNANTYETATFDTDMVVYDKNTGKIATTGKVNIDFQDKNFKTDKITFDTKSKQVLTTGEIKVKGQDLEVTSKDLIINSTNDSATLGQTNAVLDDTSFINAKSGKMQNKKNYFYDVEYTACKEDVKKCETPTWKLAVSRLKHNKDNDSISFLNIFLYLKDIPVFYFPYFMTYVKKHSGFLRPTYRNSSLLGAVVELPLFINFNDYSDLTITPIYTTKRDLLFDSEFRLNHKYGTSNTKAIYKQKYKNEKQRWYFDTNNYFELNDVWRGSFDIKRVSDDTFLRYYDYSSDPYLLSTVGIEGIWSKSFLTGNLHSYQDLRNLNNEYLPQILPSVNYVTVTDKNKYGGYFDIDFNTTNMILDYKDKNISDKKSFRTSLLSRYNQPILTDTGHLFLLGFDTRADFFRLKNMDEYNLKRIENFFYSGDITWKYPLYKNYTNSILSVEPTVQFISSKVFENTKNIPSIDSNYIELSSQNLFKTNRFAGYDSFESGYRLNYGLNYILNTNNSGNLSFFIGQNYNINTPDNLYNENSGFYNKGLSDIITNIMYQPNNFLKLKYNSIFDKKDFYVKKQDLNLYLGNNIINFNLSYIYIGEMYIKNELETKKNEIKSTINLNLHKNWKTFLSTYYNIKNKLFTENWAGISFESDCLTIDVKGVNKRIGTNDYQNETAVYFTINFKTFGAISNSVDIVDNGMKVSDWDLKTVKY